MTEGTSGVQVCLLLLPVLARGSTNSVRLATNNARIMIHDVVPLISRLSEYLSRGIFFLMHCLYTERKVFCSAGLEKMVYCHFTCI